MRKDFFLRSSSESLVFILTWYIKKVNIRKGGPSSCIRLLLSPPRRTHLSRHKSHVWAVFAFCARKHPEAPDSRVWHQTLWKPQGLSGQMGHVQHVVGKILHILHLSMLEQGTFYSLADSHRSCDHCHVFCRWDQIHLRPSGGWEEEIL